METNVTALGQIFKNMMSVSWLLQAWWIAGTLPILMASIPYSRLPSFHRLILGIGRRGKIMTSSSLSNSSQRLTVPQKFFMHFYVFSVVWNTTLLALTWHYAYNVAPLYMANHLIEGGHIFSSHSTSVDERYRVWQSVLLLLLMEIQVVSRLYESLYYMSSNTATLLECISLAISLDTIPLSLCHGCVLDVLNFAADQVAEFSVMGQEKVSVMEYDFWGYLKPMTKLGWCQFAGAAVFLWGWVHQRDCHAILGSLRRHKSDQDKHVIPRGDWFDYVSSPHYFAEMVIYAAGLIIASGGTDLTIVLAFAFTVANLSFVAGETHRWYLEKFEDYPRKRKAVIPFIY